MSALAWQPAGIGSVRVYPSDYLFAIGGTLLALVFGTQIGLFVYTALIGAICLYGARALAAIEPNDDWATFALSLFALFNPWVYGKLVEGHLAMIAAYGALMALMAELWKPRPRWTLAAFLLGPMAQLQFFVLGMAACACAAVLRRERAALLPLACGVVFALPSIIGFALDGSNVRAIPYNLDWQANESIGPIDAAALTGFFADYVRGFPPLAFDSVWSFAFLSAIGLIARRRWRSWCIAFAAAIAWGLATGTKGPFARTYDSIVAHFAPIELYRELYDVLAIVALAYVALASVATGRFAVLGRLAIAPSLILVACWFSAAPSRWWVDRSELPRLVVDAPPNSRFALYPDIGPLRFGDRGSGGDPDAYPRFRNVTPVNGSDYPYPANVALRRYAETGDAGELQALGVSRIYGRPWLSSDLRVAAGVSAFTEAKTSREVAAGARSIAGAPELSLLESIAVTTALPALGSGQIFFGDAAGLTGPDVPTAWARYEKPRPLPASNKHFLAAEDWVDVRDAFEARTELGQAMGGALTTSATAVLPIREGSNALLVHVRGRLLSRGGRILTGTTRGYAWIALPRGATGVRCDGECVVAARGNPPKLPAPTIPVSQALPLRAPVPWLAWTIVPKRPAVTMLKYLVGYDRSMFALTTSGALPHVRLETAFNGWIVDRHSEDLPLLIVDVVAASQIVLEALGFTLFVTLAWKVGRAKASGRSSLA